MKTCSKCKRKKPNKLFYKGQSRCKPCHRKRSQKQETRRRWLERDLKKQKGNSRILTQKVIRFDVPSKFIFYCRKKVYVSYSEQAHLKRIRTSVDETMNQLAHVKSVIDLILSASSHVK